MQAEICTVTHNSHEASLTIRVLIRYGSILVMRCRIFTVYVYVSLISMYNDYEVQNLDGKRSYSYP